MNELNRQTEKILDEAEGQRVEVIVQMVTERSGDHLRLARAAGQALARRRMSLSPRDVLPPSYAAQEMAKPTAESSSMRALMGKATQQALGLAEIQKVGAMGLDVLTKSDLVGKVLARMMSPAKKGGAARPRPRQFWTSRCMMLTMEKEELQQLTRDVPNIRSVSLNRRLMLPPTMESKPLGFEEAELLSATWGLEQCGALAAWGAYGARGKGVTVGLLDTGVDASHPDLAGRVKKWAEFDSAGHKITGSTAHDTDEHGTHCAGTISGGNTSGRFIGVAPEVKIAAGLVLDGAVGGTDLQVLAGIEWAVESAVDVLSMSLGGLVMDSETPSTYTEAILSCVEAGIPVVAAIGNEGHQTTGSPGNDLFALSVGAIDQRLRVAGFSGGRTQIIHQSNFINEKDLPLPYSKPDLVAPGVAVVSSVPGGKWKAFNGTSMATPHVAGAIALLLGATTIREKETGSQRAFLIQELITGAVNEMGEAGQDHRYGFGALNILRAIDFARQRGY